MRDYIRDPAEITRRSFEIDRGGGRLSARCRRTSRRSRRGSSMPAACRTSSPTSHSRTAPATRARPRSPRGAPILCDVRMVAAGMMTTRLPAGNADPCRDRRARRGGPRRPHRPDPLRRRHRALADALRRRDRRHRQRADRALPAARARRRPARRSRRWCSASRSASSARRNRRRRSRRTISASPSSRCTAGAAAAPWRRRR